MRRVAAAFLLTLVGICASVLAADDVPQASLAEHAIKESQITLLGSKPFYLMAKTYESTDRDNDSHNATIEEYWVTPDRWRRTVKTADSRLRMLFAAGLEQSVRSAVGLACRNTKFKSRGSALKQESGRPWR